MLTKIDKVEAGMADLVEVEVRELLKGTFLEESPIVRASALTREGIPQVIETLRDFLGKIGVCGFGIQRVSLALSTPAGDRKCETSRKRNVFSVGSNVRNHTSCLRF